MIESEQKIECTETSDTEFLEQYGSPPELCPISVHVLAHVRHGIRKLSVSTFHSCAGRYGTEDVQGRGTQLKSDSAISHRVTIYGHSSDYGIEGLAQHPCHVAAT
jgi:hypothetical protein